MPRPKHREPQSTRAQLPGELAAGLGVRMRWHLRLTWLRSFASVGARSSGISALHSRRAYFHSQQLPRGSLGVGIISHCGRVRLISGRRGGP